jgi:NAD+-dependent secondary alcohol dehydrogenase Adh1
MHCEANLFPGISTNGGFAEFLKTNARAVVKLPDGVEPKDVAAHADAGLTAYHAVKKAEQLLCPGTTAVVIGAGGLGHIGIQSLKVLTAARVIVVDRSEARSGWHANAVRTRWSWSTVQRSRRFGSGPTGSAPKP